LLPQQFYSPLLILALCEDSIACQSLSLMSVSKIRECENKLAEFFGRKYCVLTGNGTTALMAAYQLSPVTRPNVLMPAIACYNTLMAVHFAGKLPVLADVTEHNATIDPAAVESALERDRSIGAILAVHLYGQPANMHALKKIANRHDVLLVEDQAQAMGGRFEDGSLLGAIGDVSVISFGHTKIIDLEGGGAFLTDDPGYYENARKIVEGLPEPSLDKTVLELAYSRLYYAIWESGQSDRRFYRLFDEFPLLFRDLFVFKPAKDIAGKIVRGMETLDSEIEHRVRISTLYSDELCHVRGIRFFQHCKSAVPWRFSFCVDKNLRQTLLSRIRKEGFDISNWYPTLEWWLPIKNTSSANACPIARRIEKEIVNLWVSKDYSELRARSMAQKIKYLLRDLSRNH